MKKTIHIEGKASADFLDKLDDNYDLDVSFDFDEASADVIPNCFVRLYESDEPCTLEKALEGHLETIFGKAELTGQLYGYSEYTIEGFSVHTFKIGDKNNND